MLEIYVLCEERSKKVVNKFLQFFLPNRREIVDNYPFPEHSSESEYVYDHCDELISLLEKCKDEPYSLYWDSTENGEIKSAMIFFTEDGAMIAGLVVPEENTKTLLIRLSSIVGGDYGFVSFEAPPPDTREKFVELCRKSDQLRILDGKLVRE